MVVIFKHYVLSAVCISCVWFDPQNRCRLVRNTMWTDWSLMRAKSSSKNWMLYAHAS